MNDMDLTVPQRQEALGVIVYFFNNIRSFANALLPALAGLAVNPQWIIYIGIGLGVGLLLLAILAYFQYKRFTFHLEGEELVINEGVFVRDRTTIPFDRIQSVHLHQNFIQRILELTGVKIDTAGSSKKELEIRALKKHHALQLQKVLQEKTMHDITAETDETHEDTATERSTAGGKKVLVKLSVGELLRVAITENHIRNGLLAAAVIFGYISQYNEFFEDYLEPFIEQYIPDVQRSGFYAILLMLIVFLLISIIISVAKVFLKYFDLEASLSAKAFQVKAGLLKRNEYTIPLRKIQFMEWQTNFLRKIPGFETVKIYQGQSTEQAKKQTVDIPACFDEQTQHIEETLFPEMDNAQPFASFKADRSYILFLFTIFSSVGLVAASVGFYLESLGWIWGAYGAYLAVALLFIVKYVQSIRLKTNGELLIFERGWMFPKRMVIKTYKIQSLKWRQTIFQRRRDIGHVIIFTAAGSRAIRFLPIQLVRELHNYLLYRVETYKGSWM